MAGKAAAQGSTATAAGTSRADGASVVTGVQTQETGVQVVNDEGQSEVRVIQPWADVVEGIESFSEAELTGVDPDAQVSGESAEADAADVKTGTATTSGSKAEGTATGETADDKATSGSSDGADVDQHDGADQPGRDAAEGTGGGEDQDGGQPAVPKGYVKLEALHQARGENKFLKGRLSDLERQLNEVKTAAPEKREAPAPEWVKDFKVLDDAEVEELTENDPIEAVKYLNRLNKYNEVQRTQAQELKKQQDREQAFNQMVESAYSRIEAAVPGLFDDDPSVHDGLYEFATSIGFDDQMLALTNPRNSISINGADPVPLGDIAAGVVELLAELKGAVEGQFDQGGAKPQPQQAAQPAQVAGRNDNALDANALREQIKAEVMKEIKGDVISKLKGADSGGFASLSDVQNSGNESFATDEVLTVAQLSKLTPEQQQAYLTGRPM